MTKMDYIARLLVCMVWIYGSFAETHKGEMQTHEHQQILLDQARDRCFKDITRNWSSHKTGWCLPTWDNAQCWPSTEPGTLAVQKCPSYIFRLDPMKYSSKLCTENGTWYMRPGFPTPWTNFSACIREIQPDPGPSEIPDIVLKNVSELIVMATIGYGLSLACLIVAVIILLSLRRLHCLRNYIHVSLFIAYIIRASLWLLRDSILVDGLAPKSEVIQRDNEQLEFIQEGSHWGCKLLFTLFHYIICACVMWIFIEGFYLHAIIYWDKFGKKIRLLYLSLFAWGFPLLSVIPYVFARIYLDDTLCWNTHYNFPKLYWILRIPLIVFIIINFIFFVNIIRALYTKLSAGISMEKRRSRKLAKSTLVLIPLFGVEYIIFIAIPDTIDERVEFVKMYAEMFCNSFHGVVVALLFCFLNAEVQHEILKKWRRYRLVNHHNFSTSSPHHKHNSYSSSTQNKHSKNGQESNYFDLSVVGGERAMNGDARGHNAYHDVTNKRAVDAKTVGDARRPTDDVTDDKGLLYRDERNEVTGTRCVNYDARINDVVDNNNCCCLGHDVRDDAIDMRRMEDNDDVTQEFVLNDSIHGDVTDGDGNADVTNIHATRDDVIKSRVSGTSDNHVTLDLDTNRLINAQIYVDGENKEKISQEHDVT